MGSFLILAILLSPLSVFAGTQTYATPGNYNFTVPNYTGTLKVEVWGGGGGATSGNIGADGVSGGGSSWRGAVFAGGGEGGHGSHISSVGGGAGGTASGGSVNTIGNPGMIYNGAMGGAGGSAPNGGSGGAGRTGGSGNPGVAPGGGGGGGSGSSGGGSGGYSTYTYAANALTPGASIAVVVGAGGAGVDQVGNGAPGTVKITWGDAAPPPPSSAPACNATTNPTTKTTGTSGSQTFSTVGSGTFTVPQYDGTLTVEVWGGGQGPIYYSPFTGDSGGERGGTSAFNSTISTTPSNPNLAGGLLVGAQSTGTGGTQTFSGGVVATGGGTGPIYYGRYNNGGVASGGDVNIPGNPAQFGDGWPTWSMGGSAPFGGVGGYSPDQTTNPHGYGHEPGGGAGFHGCAPYLNACIGGGSGAYAKKTYAAGELATGSTIPVVVGAGANAAHTISYIFSTPNDSWGGNGQVKVTWTATGQTLSLCAAGYELKNGTCVSTAVCATCPAGQTMKVTPGARVAPTVTTTGGTGTPGSQTYATPGSHTFTVPQEYQTLTVEVWGGGQYPVAYGPFLGETHGAPGGTSAFNATVSSCPASTGGAQAGGLFDARSTCTPTLTGGVQATGGHMTSDPVTPGIGIGGDVNVTGNPPIQAEPGYVGIGGNAPFGGIGGFSPDPTTNPSGAGHQPGGGGGNIGCAKFICWDRGGASGGYAKKTYAAGALSPGASIPVVVGAGGAEEPSNKGGDGMVKITWTVPNAVTTTTCPTGFTLQGAECVAPDTTQCIPDTTCPTGFHFDLLTNQCVINAPTVCISGTHLDTITNQCVPDTTIITIGVPRTVGWGTTAVITWSAISASSCTGDGFDTGGATSGSYTIGPILQTTTYTLTCDTGTETATIEVPSCPVGYDGTPPVCILSSSACPAGYEGTPPNCSVAASCPINYQGTPPNCTPIACIPTNICSGNNVVNSCTGALVQACAAPGVCSGGGCIIPAPSVVSWKVTPLLVRSGNTTNVSWEVENAASCTVTGTNGDSWTGLTGTKVSGAIPTQTVFTLHCTALQGSGADGVSRSTTVNILPSFQEK